jgi:hypothetical protein
VILAFFIVLGAFFAAKAAKNRAIRYNLAALAAKFRSYPLRFKTGVW